MNKIMSITYFDIEFDNRVKRTINIGPDNWERVILYNSKKEYCDDTSNVKYLNANSTNNNPYFRFFYIQWFMFKSLIRYRPEIVICNDIQPAFAVIFYRILTFGYGKLIYDAHEMETMLYPKHYKFMSCVEWLLIKLASYVTTINKSISEYMNLKYSTDTIIIANYPSVKNFGLIKRNGFYDEYNIKNHEKLILYTGVLLPNERGVEEIIECLPSLPSNYKFLISAVGDILKFKEYVKLLCEKFNVNRERIIFVGPYTEDELIAIVSYCHVTVLLYNYRLNKNNDINTPNKLYQAYVAGTHMLMCNNTSFNRIMSESKINIGRLVDPADIKQISSAIKSITEDPNFLEQKAMIKDYGKVYLWENEFEKLNNLVFN